MFDAYQRWNANSLTISLFSSNKSNWFKAQENVHCINNSLLDFDTEGQGRNDVILILVTPSFLNAHIFVHTKN